MQKFKGQIKLIDDNRYWVVTWGADPNCRKLWERHYSKYWYKDGRDVKKFTGPGQHLVLTLPDYSALFVWCKNTIERRDGQVGVNCTIFRNESDVLSSILVNEAEVWAWERWPGERLFTYINPKRIRSTNPGYCFKINGWKTCGVSKIHGLTRLEKISA